MITYTYDGTFDGFLTCVYEGYYNKLKPEDIVAQKRFEPDLLTEEIYIPTDYEKSSKVFLAVKTKISAEALQKVFHVHLSEVKGSEMLLLNYLKLAFKIGKDIDLHLHIDTVRETLALERKVTWEAVRMLGFIRFEAIAENMYYSQIEPDHNIISLTADHFAERLSNQNWIIHDIRRETACIYNRERWMIVALTREDGKKLLARNNFYLYENLWKDYFETIAIQERKNIKAQKGHMPSRYWNNLTEFKSWTDNKKTKKHSIQP